MHLEEKEALTDLEGYFGPSNVAAIARYLDARDARMIFDAEQEGATKLMRALSGPKASSADDDFVFSEVTPQSNYVADGGASERMGIAGFLEEHPYTTWNSQENENIHEYVRFSSFCNQYSLASGPASWHTLG